MGPGFGPPMHQDMNERLKEPRPTSVKEVPLYLKNVMAKFFSRLFYIVKLVWEAKPSLLLLMVFMAFFNGITPVIGSLISANLITKLARVIVLLAETGVPCDISYILFPLILQFSYLFFTNLVNQINQIITNISSEIVTNHIKIKIMNKAREVDLASFDMPDFYERLENANREAGTRPINVLRSTFGVVSTIISVVSYIIILCAVAWWMPVVVILLSAPSAIITMRFRRKNFLYMRRRSKDRRQLSYYSNTMVNKDLVKEIKLFGLSDTFISRYKEVFAKYFAGIKKLVLAEGIWSISISLVTTSVNCMLFLYIANRVRLGYIAEIGTYSLYTGALNSISHGVSSFINTVSSIYEGTLFIDNMILFMNEKKNIVSSLPCPRKVTHHIGHTIEFRHVSFSYPGVEKKVLSDINLKLEAGDTAVLVGLNGAGKTTLIKLLTRLYDPTEGEILLDGYNIKEYDPDELYKLFGIIFQDFGKYAVSVFENIAFGQIGKKHEQANIEYAATQSSANDFIEALPRKYETPLMRYFEPDGIELSIGQWQKLSIARAFYSDSDILILDEPTASLDPMAEQEIFNQFDSLRKGKTTLFISHRLSSATTANKIIVLENGRIVEIGDHRTLMHKHGKYYELFSTQASRYIINTEDGAKCDPENADITDGDANNHMPKPYKHRSMERGSWPSRERRNEDEGRPDKEPMTGPGIFPSEQK